MAFLKIHRNHFLIHFQLDDRLLASVYSDDPAAYSVLADCYELIDADHISIDIQNGGTFIYENISLEELRNIL